MRTDRIKTYDTVIIGSGLAGLMAACSLWEQDKRSMAILSSGYGGAPYIAAFNAVLPDNPYGDSTELYCSDMLSAGYGIGNKELIYTLGEQTGECIAMLERWGVSFSRLENGQYRLRRASGSSCPRSLCRTDMLVGEHIVNILKNKLLKRGSVFYDNAACVSLLAPDGRIAGLAYKRDKEEVISALRAASVLAAWGGVGNLYKKSTYPADIDGRTLAMAHEAGASLIDLEFVEFEPMVCLEPAEAAGEPCPTAMLGEGAYLLNNKSERFLLKARPQGEAGAPKSLINHAIYTEAAAGRGSPLGGVYVDMRHISQEALEAYPWFCERLKNAGLNVKQSLLQVGPMSHSHSGGLEIDCGCMTNIKGLFAAGEAAGGMHGACRMAGNAATQAAVSGLIAAKSIVRSDTAKTPDMPELPRYTENLVIRGKILPEIKNTVSKYIEKDRYAAGLSEAVEKLTELRGQALDDTFTSQCALSGILLATAAFSRKESRGAHNRKDFPIQRDEFNCSIRIKNENGIKTECVAR